MHNLERYTRQIVLKEIGAIGQRKLLSSAVAIIGAIEVSEGIKLLTSQEKVLHSGLLYIDFWDGTFKWLDVGKSNVPCLACDLGEYEFLNAWRDSGSWWRSLCVSSC